MRLPLSGQGKGALDVIELSLEGSLLPIIPYPLCLVQVDENYREIYVNAM